MKAKKEISDAKKQLIALSSQLKLLVKAGQFDSVNEALIAFYKSENEEIKTFKTFAGWKAENKRIVKGSKAFHIWGRKREALKKDAQAESIEAATDEQKFKFWPVACLFADIQTEELK
jgi:hypothetical protein